MTPSAPAIRLGASNISGVGELRSTALSLYLLSWLRKKRPRTLPGGTRELLTNSYLVNDQDLQERSRSLRSGLSHPCLRDVMITMP
jgi:hypothetical protein